MAFKFLKPFFFLLLTGLIGLAWTAGPLSAQKQKTRDLVYEEEAGAGGGQRYTPEQRKEILTTGYTLYKNKKYKEAAAHYERFLPAIAAQVGEHQPGIIQAKFIWGYCQFKANQPPRKVAELLEPVVEKQLQSLSPADYKLYHVQGLIALAEAKLELGRPREAAEMANQAVELLKPLDDPKKTNTIDALYVVARAATTVKDFDQGIELYRRIIKLEQAAYPPPAHNSIFTSWVLAETLVSGGRAEEALALLNANAKALKAHKYHYIVVQGNVEAIALTLSRMGRYEESLAKYKEALAILEKAGRGDSASAAIDYAAMAWVAKDLGRYEEAAAQGEKAWALYQRHLGPKAEMTIRHAQDLSAIYADIGRLDRSLEVLDETLPLVTEAYGERGGLTIDVNLAKAGRLMTVGESEAALALFEKYMSDAEKVFGRDDPMLITAYNNIGALYGNLPDDKPENKKKCYEYMERAAESTRRIYPPDHPMILDADRALAQAAMDNKDYDRAEAILRELMPRAKKVYGEEHRLYFRTLQMQALLHKRKGETERSIELYKELLPGTASVGDSWDLMSVCNSLRENYMTLNRLDEAAFYGRQAVEAGQKLRQGLTRAKPDVRRSLARKLTETYQGLADILMKQNKVSEAQKVMSLLKVDELADLEAPATGAPAQAEAAAKTGAPADSGAILAGVDPDIARRYQEISGNLAALGEEQRALLEKRKSGETLSAQEERRLKDLRLDMTAARKVFASFVDNLSTELAKSGGRQAADLGNLETYQRLLGSMGEGTVLLQTILTEERLWLILTTPNALVARESPLDVKTLTGKIVKYRDVLQDPDKDARPLAKEFYEAIIGPLAESLRQAGAKTIMFSLDGQLRYIPMATLYDGQKWLIQNYRVALFNDAARAGLAVPQVGNWKVAGMGVTKGHTVNVDGKRGQFSALPAVKDELAAIVKTKNNKNGVLQGSISLDEKFTSDTLAEVLEAGYPVVHLASHFHFDAKNPENSFLLLGDGSGLPLTKIETEDYKFKNVDLLALSACQTARGGVDATGKEIEGFGALAQKRGAKAVLATLWPVFDESTGFLMSDFYRIHADNQKPSIAESLRQAQLTMIEKRVEGKDYQHPFYWGPFVLMGDWR